MDTEQQKEVAKLFAAKFIARSDVKAIQRSNGDYNPHVDREGNLLPGSGFAMQDLLNHISGSATYGHYLLNKDSQCKLFVFDIDLDKPDPQRPETYDQLVLPTDVDSDGVWCNFAPCNPREVWLDRSKTLARNYLKFQLRMMANTLAAAIHKELEIPVAAAYTGNKGVHVYGFTGLMPAADVRDGAMMVLDSLGTYAPSKGQNFFKHKPVATGDSIIDEELSYQCMTVEVFPKQVSLEGKTYGNLCRLPLGKNQKNPQDPTFFLDFRGNIGSQSFMQRDPIDALTTTDYWR